MVLYCGQTVGWIKMKLGMEVGLGPVQIVLDGDPAPRTQRGTAPHFSAHVCCGKTAGWIKMPLGTEVGLDPRRRCVVWGPISPPKWGKSSPSLFGACIVAKRPGWIKIRGRLISLVVQVQELVRCVCLSEQIIIFFKLNDLWPRYLLCWFVSKLSACWMHDAVRAINTRVAVTVTYQNMIQHS